jgi:hypothetical protein
MGSMPARQASLLVGGEAALVVFVTSLIRCFVGSLVRWSFGSAVVCIHACSLIAWMVICTWLNCLVGPLATDGPCFIRLCHDALALARLRLSPSDPLLKQVLAELGGWVNSALSTTFVVSLTGGSEVAKKLTQRGVA